MNASEVQAEYRRRIEAMRRLWNERRQPDSTDRETLPLDRLFVEKLLSEIKHGIVEASFYNIRVMAQIKDSEEDGFHAQAWSSSLANLASMKQTVEEWLSILSPSGHDVTSVLGESGNDLRDQFEGLWALLERNPPPSRQWVEVVDGVLDSLRAASESLLGQRISLAKLWEEAFSIERPRLTAHEIQIEFLDQAEGGRFHGDPVKVRDCLIEVLRNVSRHSQPNEGFCRIFLAEGGGWLRCSIQSGPIAPSGDQGGEGLPLIRERIEEIGGIFFAGPSKNAPLGFDVEFQLPTRFPSGGLPSARPA
ncbi:MAG: ATP-binding protein [Planctomycetota bacterium]|nr:MAG: ATP-binding protein [Planctomycetota bacterium]